MVKRVNGFVGRVRNIDGQAGFAINIAPNGNSKTVQSCVCSGMGKVYKKAFKSGKPDYKKVIQRLKYRGFDWDTINYVLEKFSIKHDLD